MNEWYFGLGFAQGNPPNKTINRVDRFAAAIPVLKMNTKVNLPKVDHKNLLIGAYKANKNGIQIIAANPTSTKQKEYRPYEIRYQHVKVPATKKS